MAELLWRRERTWAWLMWEGIGVSVRVSVDVLRTALLALVHR